MPVEFLLVALLVKSRPISNAGVHEADVNKVEMIVWVCPDAAAVVDLKMDIRGSVIRLNRREVGS